MNSKFPSLKKIASFKTAKLFWNASFTSERLQISEIYDDVDRNWEITLRNFRAEAKYNMNAFIKNGSLPRCLRYNLNSAISSVHKAYYQLLSWKIIYDPDNKIELLQHGEHYAPNSFTLDGEFNDLVWTERFVLDSKCPTIDRFNLACCYWLENESSNLWSEIKNSYVALYGENYGNIVPEFLKIFRNNSYFISIRLAQLEHRLDTDYFWNVAFNAANDEGYEHAIYYTWQKLSFSRKNNIMESNRFFKLMSYDIDYPNDKISFFLYTQLSRQRKSSLLNWTIRHERSKIWYTLLTTPYAKDIRGEVIEFYKSLPFRNLSDIFHLIAHRIKKHKLRSDKIMFEVLWRSLKPGVRHDTLIDGPCFMYTLAQAKSFFNLRSIVKSLSNNDKNKCLLLNYCGGGIDVLDTLTTGGDFDFLREYLYSFLKEFTCTHNKWYHCIHDRRFPCIVYKCIPCTEKTTIRKNANKLFEKFINSSDFIRWYENTISEVERKQVREIINDIDASLTLLSLQNTA